MVIVPPPHRVRYRPGCVSLLGSARGPELCARWSNHPADPGASLHRHEARTPIAQPREPRRLCARTSFAAVEWSEKRLSVERLSERRGTIRGMQAATSIRSDSAYVSGCDARASVLVPRVARRGAGCGTSLNCQATQANLEVRAAAEDRCVKFAGARPSRARSQQATVRSESCG